MEPYWTEAVKWLRQAAERGHVPGGVVQGRPRYRKRQLVSILKPSRFQKFNLMKGKLAFDLNLVFLELAPLHPGMLHLASCFQNGRGTVGLHHRNRLLSLVDTV